MTVPRTLRLTGDRAASSLTEAVEGALAADGAVILAGLPPELPLPGVRAALGLCPAQVEERFGSRDERDGVFGAYVWPPGERMCPTQEQTSASRPPELVLVRPSVGSGEGGAPLLADVTRVVDHIPGPLLARVRDEGWCLERCFHPGFGMSWAEAFGVVDQEQLADRLDAAGISWQWEAQGVLRTRRRLAGWADHPSSGSSLWFNQLAFLNTASLAPSRRAVLEAAFGDAMPVETRLGDGTPLSTGEVTAVQDAYDAASAAVDLPAGDVLVIDNYRVASGREPFVGEVPTETVFAYRGGSWAVTNEENWNG